MKKLFLAVVFISMFASAEAKADLAAPPCFPFGCGALGAVVTGS